MVSTVSVNNALFTLYKSNNFILYYRTLRTVKQEYPFSFLCNITLPLHPSIFLSSSIPHSSILLRSISLTRLSKALTCSSRWAVFSTAEPPPAVQRPIRCRRTPGQPIAVQWSVSQRCCRSGWGRTDPRPRSVSAATRPALVWTQPIVGPWTATSSQWGPAEPTGQY